MTREQLLGILNANGVRYDRDIEKAETEGYVSDECAAFAEKLYGDMYTLAAYGVNYGFGKCDEDIKDLSKLIASLVAGTSRKTVNLVKTEAKRQQILKGANYLKKEIDMDIVNQLNGNLNACIDAADAIATIRRDNASLCAKLEESKSVLEEIKETLSHVADASSKTAAEYQVKIFEALMDWREAVSRYNCYSDTVDGLKGALKEAKEWQKLTSTVRHKAKRGVDYYEYRDDMDDVGLIIRAAKFAERTDGMRDHLNDFRNQTALLYSAEALQGELEKAQKEYLDERNSINARLGEIKEETDSLLISYQNGEIDAVTADMKVGDLDDEAADLQERLSNIQEDFEYESKDLKVQIRDAQDGSRVRDKIAKNFEDFVKKIEAYRNTDPAMFVILWTSTAFTTRLRADLPTRTSTRYISPSKRLSARRRRISEGRGRTSRASTKSTTRCARSAVRRREYCASRSRRAAKDSRAAYPCRAGLPPPIRRRKRKSVLRAGLPAEPRARLPQRAKRRTTYSPTSATRTNNCF